MTSSSAQPARPASPLSSPLQRPQLAQTTLLSPYHQCFRLGVQSYTPAPHSPDTRRWPPNPRTPSRPAQGSNPPAQCEISRTAEPFPPTLRRPSSKHLITKAWADRKRATAATPWPSKTGYTRLRSQPNSPLPWANLPSPPTTPRLISRSRAVLLAPPPSPPCGQEAECHGRSTTGSPHDQSGQRRIHEELADAHLALRPAPHMPSYHPPPSPSRVSWGRP